MKKPKLEVKYSDLVSNIKQRFLVSGLMQTIQLDDYIRELEYQVAAYEEIYGEYLRKEWTTLFPQVPFSEELLRKEIYSELKKEKDKAVAEFKRLLKRQERLRLFFYWIFRKWDLYLLIATLSSFITLPFWLSQFFAKTDLQFHIGWLGLFSNLALLVFLFFKSFNSLTKS